MNTGSITASQLLLGTSHIPRSLFINYCCQCTHTGTMPKKTIVSVELLCSKCRQKVMKLIATIEGITSIVLDPSKNTVTVVGDADPVRIIHKVRKFRKTASIVSIGPPKDEKKDEKEKEKDEKKGMMIYSSAAPKTCQRCDVWYVVGEDNFSYCSIM